MIIGHGAEAILKKNKNILVKERMAKGYRLKVIDSKLRKERTKKEANLMMDARRHGIKVPRIVGKHLEDMSIEMEFIDGPVLRDKLNKLSKKNRDIVCKEIGEMVAKMHLANLIHGDLTTSNMILKNGKIDKLYFIDFGLGFYSLKIEDKAVDLHLLKQALVSKHNKIWKECYLAIIRMYSKEVGKETAEKIKQRIEKIEKRGRYTQK